MTLAPALGLVAITLGGLALRLHLLDSFGVWFDEAYHVALVREPTVGAMVDAVLSNPPSDPLYALILRWWTALAGAGDVAFRLPSVLFGTATIPAAAWLASALGSGSRSALLAAAFVAVSPYGLEFSQEAAPYALAALAMTLALAAAWRWRATGSRAAGVAFVLAGIVAVYSHYVAVAVLALTGLLGALRWAGRSRVTPRAWLAAHTAIGLAWMPWAVGLVIHWANTAVPRTSLRSPTSLESVAYAAAQYGSGTPALLAGARPLQGAALLLGIVLLALGWRAGRDPDRRGLRVLIAVAAVVFLVPAVVSMLTSVWVFVAHFMLLLLPALLVVAAAGVGLLARVTDGLGGRVVATGLALSWLLVEIVGTAWYHADPPHGDDGLRTIAATIAAEPDVLAPDPILVSPSILEPSLAHYLQRPLSGIPRPFDLRDVYGPFVRPAADGQLAAATLAAAGDASTLWLVYRPELDPREVVPTTLSMRYTLLATLRTEFATLMRFERASGARP